MQDEQGKGVLEVSKGVRTGGKEDLANQFTVAATLTSRPDGGYDA